MLYSALCNMQDQMGPYPTAPYPTARAPGQPPISVADYKKRRNAAIEQLSAQRAVGQHEVSSSREVTGCRYTRSGLRYGRSGQTYSRAAPLPAGALHLTCRLVSLAGEVFLGRCAAHLPYRPVDLHVSGRCIMVQGCEEVARAHAQCMNSEVCP